MFQNKVSRCITGAKTIYINNSNKLDKRDTLVKQTRQKLNEVIEKYSEYKITKHKDVAVKLKLLQA